MTLMKLTPTGRKKPYIKPFQIWDSTTFSNLAEGEAEKFPYLFTACVGAYPYLDIDHHDPARLCFVYMIRCSVLAATLASPGMK